MNAVLKLRAFFAEALDVAFPSRCAHCEGVTKGELAYPGLCDSCAGRLRTIEEPKCLTCGFPFFGDAESHGSCMHCEHLSPAFGQGWSVALFRGPLRDLIYALKYKDGFWALRDLRRLLQEAPGLEAFVGDAWLVPVPLHPRKLRERGYNQSALIADLLVECCPAARRQDLLRRDVDTVSQTEFDRAARIRNLKNAFSLRQKGAIPAEQRILVVDDVFTTGSTVNACAAALRRGGARRVDVLTIGHG